MSRSRRSGAARSRPPTSSRSSRCWTPGSWTESGSSPEPGTTPELFPATQSRCLGVGPQDELQTLRRTLRSERAGAAHRWAPFLRAHHLDVEAQEPQTSVSVERSQYAILGCRCNLRDEVAPLLQAASARLRTASNCSVPETTSITWTVLITSPKGATAAFTGEDQPQTSRNKSRSAVRSQPESAASGRNGIRSSPTNGIGDPTAQRCPAETPPAAGVEVRAEAWLDAVLRTHSERAVLPL
jgi:hypothetical protein